MLFASAKLTLCIQPYSQVSPTTSRENAEQTEITAWRPRAGLALFALYCKAYLAVSYGKKLELCLQDSSGKARKACAHLSSGQFYKWMYWCSSQQKCKGQSMRERMSPNFFPVVWFSGNQKFDRGSHALSPENRLCSSTILVWRAGLGTSALRWWAGP